MPCGRILGLERHPATTGSSHDRSELGLTGAHTRCSASPTPWIPTLLPGERHEQVYLTNMASLEGKLIVSVYHAVGDPGKTFAAELSGKPLRSWPDYPYFKGTTSRDQRQQGLDARPRPVSSRGAHATHGDACPPKRSTSTTSSIAIGPTECRVRNVGDHGDSILSGSVRGARAYFCALMLRRPRCRQTPRRSSSTSSGHRS